MVPGRQEREERGRLCGDPARKRHCAAASLEVCHPLLEHRHGRIHDPRVGIPAFLQVEIGGRRFRILEHVTRGLVNRHGARAGVRIGTLPCVDLTGVEAEVAGFFH